MALKQLIVVCGVELASSWVNMMLYMLEIVLCLRYFQRTSRPWPHKVGIGAMMLFDTICTMAVDVNVFLTFLSFLEKRNFFIVSTPTSLTIFMTYLTAAVEQFFLCHLYFVLTRRRVVCLSLVLLGLIHLGLSFASGILIHTALFADRLTFQVTAAGAILCAVEDLLIAGLLGYEFYKIKSKGKARQDSKQDWLRRIFILSITSGAIVASTTLLMMILLLTGNIAFEFFFSCQGRVYALTLLVNYLSGPSSSSPGSSTPSDAEQQHNNIDQSTVVFRYPVFSATTNASSRNGPRVTISRAVAITAPSIYSNFSEESREKDLPPLPMPSGPLPPTPLKLEASIP